MFLNDPDRLCRRVEYEVLEGSQVVALGIDCQPAQGSVIEDLDPGARHGEGAAFPIDLDTVLETDEICQRAGGYACPRTFGGTRCHVHVRMAFSRAMIGASVTVRTLRV